MVFIDPNKQLPDGPTTVNEAYFDALVRHQIGLMRLSGSIQNQVIALLNDTEADIAMQIRDRLRNVKGGATTQNLLRLQQLQKVINNIRGKAWSEVTEVWVERLTEIAKAEPAFLSGALATVSPVIVETTLPSPDLLRSIVRARPFQGRSLRDWASDIKRADLQRIQQQIKIGVTNGETGDQIARRVVGSARLRGRGGTTQITRNQAKAITRTAVNGIANYAKREFYQANPGIFSKELFVATLDESTSAVCRANDGRTYDVGQGPIPPLHMNCRSLRVATIGQDALQNRPMKASTNAALLREFTRKRGIAGPRGGTIRSRDALPRGTKGAFDDFARRRIRQLTGTTTAKTDYASFLRRQSAAFQDDVLGATKGRLFRDGGLPLSRFVNRRGDELTLSQLAVSDRRAFVRAGLDPSDYL